MWILIFIKLGWNLKKNQGIVENNLSKLISNELKT